jgi:hypothetical protein
MADIAALFDIYQKGLVFHCLCAVTRLRIPDALAEGPRELPDLTADRGLDEDALRRVLYLLAGHGVVAFSGSGTRVSLTPTGRLLADGHPMGLRATFATVGISDVAHALADVLRTGRAAAPAVFGADFWAHLAAVPDRQTDFSQAMAEQAQLLTLPCVDLLDWPVGIIADLAGGSGILLTEVLHAAPDAHGILIDEPVSVERGRARLAAAGLAHRCTVQPGDLFAPPPPADMYLLSRVVHDWDDEHAIRIFQAIAASANSGARLRLFEDLLPEKGLPTPLQAWSDVVMMALYPGARERTLSQYRALLAAAGWQLEAAVAGPPGMCVVEAVRAAA